MKLLQTFSITDQSGNLSVTNIIVFLFSTITAFKLLFSGLYIHYPNFHWKIEALDTSTTLPLLFSLLNYGHKRIVNQKYLDTTNKVV